MCFSHIELKRFVYFRTVWYISTVRRVLARDTIFDCPAPKEQANQQSIDRTMVGYIYISGLKTSLDNFSR